MTRRTGVVVALVAVTVAVAAALATWGLPQQQEVEDFLDGAGLWGYVAYVLGFTALQPLSLPGALLIVPATFVWSAPKVFLLSWLGGVLASTIGFALARWLGRDWIEERLPARFLVWDERLERRGFLATVALRVLTGLAPPADWVLGLSAVRWPAFLAGTAVGLIPNVALLAWFGDDAVRYVERAPLVVGGAAAAVVLVLVIRRRRAG